MRELTAGQRERVAADITAPRYLIETELSTPLYLSTREGVEVDGVWYEPDQTGPITIGDREAVISIYNHNYQYTLGAVTGAYSRKRVKIYSCYASADTEAPASAGKILVFAGVIDKADELDEFIRLICRRSTPKTHPTRVIRPPFANHLPPAGMVIEWNGDTYRIDD